MIDRTLLNRYTRAFIEAVIAKKSLDTVETQLVEVDALLKKSVPLSRILRNPLVEKEKKKSLLLKVLGPSVDPLLRNFLFLLVDKRREEVIPFLCEEFSRLADEQRNVVRAEVESAFPLSPRQLEQLTEKLSGISGKKVVIRQTASPEIIGGLYITLGSKIIDASVAGRLRKAKECMFKAGVGGISV